jgi:hypothetical protein
MEKEVGVVDAALMRPRCMGQAERAPRARKYSLILVLAVVSLQAIGTRQVGPAAAWAAAQPKATVWVHRYNGPGNSTDEAHAVAASPDGTRVYVSGGSTGSGSGEDYATVAYDGATGAKT